MNKTVKNEVAVIEKPVVKKSRTKKTTVTAVAPVTPVTTTAVAPVANKSITNKLLTFDETMTLMNECGIGSKSHTKNYRIMNGGSSIHVLKTKYRIYMTTIDFEYVKHLKSLNTDDNVVIELLQNDNSVDEKRPHTVLVHTTNALKQVFTSLSHNVLNAPC